MSVLLILVGLCAAAAVAFFVTAYPGAAVLCLLVALFFACAAFFEYGARRWGWGGRRRARATRRPGTRDAGSRGFAGWTTGGADKGSGGDGGGGGCGGG
ncbi:hypothetical protein [Nocardia sp. NPDC050435]